MDDIWWGWDVRSDQHSAPQLVGEKQRKADREQQKSNDQLKLIAELNQLIPGAQAGQTALIFSEEAMVQLDLWLEKQQELSVHRQHHLRRFLRKGLTKGQKFLQWQVTLPPPIILLPSVFNPLTPTTFAEIQVFRKQLAQFQESLRQGWSEHVKENSSRYTRLRWGQYIYSAVVFGGLLDQAALLQLAHCRSKLQRFNELVWVDLFTDEYPKSTQANRGTRRWFLDPTTLNLLMALPALPSDKPYDRDRDQLRTWLYECLIDFLDYLNPASLTKATDRSRYKTMIAKVRHWYSTAANYLYLILPPYLVEHANGQSHATALHKSTWERLLRKQRPPAELFDKSEATPLDNIDARPALNTFLVTLTANADEKITAFNDIKAALYRDRKQGKAEPTWRTVQEAMEQIKPRILATSTLLGGLLCWIQERHKAKEIVRSSAYQQLTSIAQELMAQLDDDDIPTMEAEDFQELYTEIVERCPAVTTRSNKADLLRRFHHYMEGFMDWPHLNFSYDDNGMCSQADANMLSNEEYNVLYRYLVGQKSAPLRHAQLILLILGFRCGLRINEAIHVRLEDIQYRWMMHIADESPTSLASASVTLLVRSNHFNRLKTVDSRRLLPLDVFLSAEERRELLSYHQIQRTKVGNHVDGRYLFSIAPQNQIPISAQELQAPLHALLRQVTGDPLIRFHHLRHAFATHLLQAFAGDQSPLTLPAHWYDETCEPAEGGVLRKLLISDGGASRKGLFQIAEWIGHTGPSVTLTHYLHNLDYLLKTALDKLSFTHQRNGLGVTRQFVRDVELGSFLPSQLQLSDANFRKLCSRSDGIMSWLADRLGICNLALNGQGWQVLDECKFVYQEAAPRTIFDFGFDDWITLLTHWRKGESNSVIEYFLYLPEESLSQIQDRLKELCELKGKKSAKRLIRGAHSTLPSIPRAEEKTIAKQCFSLLQKSMKDEINTIRALRYFATYFRISENHMLLMPHEDNRISYDCFMAMISNVLPKNIDLQEQQGVQVGIRPAFSKLRFVNKKTQQASYGVYFALILASAILTATSPL